MLPVKRAKFALSHRQNVILLACQHCIHRGEWGVFFLFPGMERIVTLLEGGEMLLESADRFNHTLKPLQPFAFAADQVVKAKLTEGQMSMDFNIMTRLDVCKAKVRIAERTFTTFGSRGGWCL